jgi:outer membrane lipoprotein SlyB
LSSQRAAASPLAHRRLLNQIRQGVIEQITPTTLADNHHAGVGAVVGGLAGLGIGSLIGGGSGRDVAMVAGSLGGAQAHRRPTPGRAWST